MNWQDTFKPDVKSSGQKLRARGVVSVSSVTDTTVQAYVRIAPVVTVRFDTDAIDAPAFTARCTCSVGKKGRLCKHEWAVLLEIGESHPDFLSEKRSVDVAAESANVEAGPSTVSLSPTEDGAETIVADFRTTAKQRAADYRKAQYERQKAHAKEKRDAGKTKRSSSLRVMSEEVVAACKYFADNGFPMPGGPSSEAVGEAKKKLSRVFHPDRGGTHEEIIELNRNCDVILGYLNG